MHVHKVDRFLWSQPIPIGNVRDNSSDITGDLEIAGAFAANCANYSTYKFY